MDRADLTKGPFGVSEFRLNNVYGGLLYQLRLAAHWLVEMHGDQRFTIFIVCVLQSLLQRDPRVDAAGVPERVDDGSARSAPPPPPFRPGARAHYGPLRPSRRPC